jgi:hypothetical protein
MTPDTRRSRDGLRDTLTVQTPYFPTHDGETLSWMGHPKSGGQGKKGTEFMGEPPALLMTSNTRSGGVGQAARPLRAAQRAERLDGRRSGGYSATNAQGLCFVVVPLP